MPLRHPALVRSAADPLPDRNFRTPRASERDDQRDDAAQGETKPQATRRSLYRAIAEASCRIAGAGIAGQNHISAIAVEHLQLDDGSITRSFSGGAAAR